MSNDMTYYWGTGRRKTSVARVRVSRGEGRIEVNNRKINEYFPNVSNQEAILAPLKLTKHLKNLNVFANVSGGGASGQAGAIVLGISRALCLLDENNESVLRENNLLTRDSRMRERKKYGQKGARARFQFSKR
jgi:small subunit ribosomal protein S9